MSSHPTPALPNGALSFLAIREYHSRSSSSEAVAVQSLAYALKMTRQERWDKLYPPLVSELKKALHEVVDESIEGERKYTIAASAILQGVFPPPTKEKKGLFRRLFGV